MDNPTQFEISRIVERCFVEVVDAGLAKTDLEHMIILDQKAVALHIQKTLIAELLEFEIIRKAAAGARALKSADNDMQFIFAKTVEANAMPKLKSK